MDSDVTGSSNPGPDEGQGPPVQGTEDPGPGGSVPGEGSSNPGPSGGLDEDEQGSGNPGPED